MGAKTNLFCSVTLLISLIGNSYAKLETIEDLIPTKISLTRCLVNASLKYIPNNAFVIISIPVKNRFTNNMDYSYPLNELVLPALFEQNKWTFLLRKPDRHQPHRFYQKKTDVYIVIVQEDTELSLHLLKMQQHFSWNPHAIIMVVSDTPFSNKRKVAGRMLIELKRFKVYKAILLLLSDINPLTFEVLTWNPYSRENCGDKLHTMRIIDRCINGEFIRSIDWFKGIIRIE